MAPNAGVICWYHQLVTITPGKAMRVLEGNNVGDALTGTNTTNNKIHRGGPVFFVINDIHV